MPTIHNLAIVLPMFHIMVGMTVVFAMGAMLALAWAWRCGLFSHHDDIAVRMLDFEDRPLASPRAER